MAWSAPINIVRYSNGTLVKLTASAERFVSYNYDPKDGSGTYTPGVITVTASFEGDVKYGHWEASSDGQNWNTISNGDYGITLTSTGASVPPTSSLFGERNSYFMLKMVGDDGEHYDTVTISREVDPTVVYRKSYTDFVQTNDKIALIASAEQLAQFSTGETMKTVMDAEITETAKQIRLAVSAEIDSDISKATTEVYQTIDADGIRQEVKNTNSRVDDNGQEIATLRSATSMLDETGLHVTDSASPDTQTDIDGKGVKVVDRNGIVLLEATTQGVNAQSLTSNDSITLNTDNILSYSKEYTSSTHTDLIGIAHYVARKTA